jgi:hypothetical protein
MLKIPTRRQRIAQVVKDAIPGYIRTMLFANTMTQDASGELTTSDQRDARIGKDARKAACSDIRDFVRSIYSLDVSPKLAAERDAFITSHGARELGSCFALSRNGHGAGFFDRGIGFPELQAWAKTFGSATWILSSNGNAQVLE